MKSRLFSSSILIVLLVVVLWASAFAGIRAGLASYSPQSVALLRYLTASVVLGVYALVTKMPLPRLRDLPGLAATGFLGFTLYNVALNVGEQRVPAGEASLIVAGAPIFVSLLAGIFYGERLRPLAWLGILLSFLGVAVISIRPGSSFDLTASALLVLAATLSQSLYTTSQKAYLKRYSPLQCTTYAIWFGTLFLLVFLPGLIHQLPAAAPAATLAVVYMGVFPGVIGYVSWSFVLSRLPAARASSFLYLVPGFSILIAWVWLGEVPDLTALLGGALILVGVIWVNVWKSSGRRSVAGGQRRTVESSEVQ